MTAQRDRAVVEHLRERIRRLQAAPQQQGVVRLRTGVGPFDGLWPAGGLALGHALELWGEAASGRTSLALRVVAAAHRERRLGAYVDGPGELYPPAAAAAGVDLSRLLIVRPREPGRLVWTAVQLARSGAFGCVVLDLTHTAQRLGAREAKKLSDAAFRGGSLLVLLTPPEAPGEGLTRLRTCARGVEGLGVEVVHARHGAAGARTLIPWQVLYPALAAVGGGHGGLLPGGLPGGDVTLPPGQQRERASPAWHRGGPGGRPGRDAPLPSLRALLPGD